MVRFRRNYTLASPLTRMTVSGREQEELAVAAQQGGRWIDIHVRLASVHAQKDMDVRAWPSIVDAEASDRHGT